MSISIKFKARLCELVEETDYTRSELRKELKISSTALTNALVYGILPTPKTIVKIADYFEISLDYLLGKSDTNEYSPPIEPISFYQRFNELCQEKNVTYYKISNDCGFSHSLILRWFSKNYLPSIEILEILCDYFKVSPDYLLGRSNYKY